MSNDNLSIHAFDLDMICDYFVSLERQGPGSPEMTIKALGFIEGLSESSRILDIGCGSGGQTRVLAQHAPGQITGIDLFPRFIEVFKRAAEEGGLTPRVTGRVGSMEDLPYGEGELDLIWCEGAIYNIGFEQGLRQWRPLLKPGGFIAVTEACWLSDERPAEIDAFWQQDYPGIDTVPRKLQQFQDAGYNLKACFVLPPNCWIDHYHRPQEAMQEAFLARHPDDQAAAQFLAFQRREAEMYRTYGAFYGYVFFIGQRQSA